MVSAPSFSADYQKGLDAYNRGDYQAALREWRPLAEQGHADAQARLGLMYDLGLGVAQSNTYAVMWYSKSAKQGDLDGKYNVGLMHAEGRTDVSPHIVQSDAEALRWFRGDTEVKWYRLAAEQGNAKAQLILGGLYKKGGFPREGFDVAQSDVEAVRWYRKSAEQGHARAQFELALMFSLGRGVWQSDTEAVKWLRKSAEQGHARAQASLGGSYLNGSGF